MQALNAVMMLFQASVRPIGPESLVELYRVLANLIDCLFPIEGNHADLAGFAPLPAGHYVHPIKTAEAAALLGRATGMPRSRLIQLATSASLMNVGYLLLKQSLIDEPRRLIDGEWEQQVHTHPALSVTALTSSGLPHETIVAIGQHHERWDGSGYPHGVRGNDICAESRILAIADTFISLRSERPYRGAMTTEQALQVIVAESGRLYEPSLVDAFVDVVGTYGEKEEQKALAGAATASKAEESASDPQRSGAGSQQREEFAEARRDEDGARDAAAAASRRASAGKSRQAPPAVVPTMRQPAISPRAPVRARTTVIKRRARPRSAPRAASASRRPRRTLFSTDVFVRSACSGDWLG